MKTNLIVYRTLQTLCTIAAVIAVYSINTKYYDLAFIPTIIFLTIALCIVFWERKMYD